MLFCSTNELRQSAVDSLEESRSPATTIKVPNFFQFKSEQISIFTCVSCTHNNLWYTSYRHNYLVVCRHLQVAWHRQVKKWAVASCKQLITSIVQGIVIGHCPFHNFKSSNLQRSVLSMPLQLTGPSAISLSASTVAWMTPQSWTSFVFLSP